jgi:hypothetical protein
MDQRRKIKPFEIEAMMAEFVRNHERLPKLAGQIMIDFLNYFEIDDENGALGSLFVVYRTAAVYRAD